jgi:tryptophan halogenase
MPIRKIVIAGGGVAGWCIASALARKTTYQIELIETADADNSLGPVTPVLPMPSSASLFHARLGIDQDALMAACGGTFSLGTAYSGLTPQSASAAFIPHGEAGAALGPIGFQHLIARMRAEGRDVRLGNYALATLSAQAARFARAPAGDRSVLSTLEHSLHLDSKGYAAWLKADAIARGVATHQGGVTESVKGEDCLIDALHLADGRRIDGDLFIDATGAASPLLDTCKGPAFENWSGRLPLDRSAARLVPDGTSPPAYAHIDIQPAGWLRFSPVQGGMAEHLVYASSYAGETFDSVHAERWTPGRRAKPWRNNCIAIGAAAIVIDPTSAIPIALLHRAVERLIALLPNRRTSQVESTEYNRLFDEDCDAALDLTMLPLLRNNRQEDSFWRQCSMLRPPDRLAHRIALYENTGRVALYDGDLLEAGEWVGWFDALAVYPKHYDIMADALPLAQIEAHLEKVRKIMLGTLAQMPTHGEYLMQHCASGVRNTQ